MRSLNQMSKYAYNTEGLTTKDKDELQDEEKTKDEKKNILKKIKKK